MNPAVVVVTYNRPKSLIRLLRSIDSAYYKSNDVTLVISIDYEESRNHSEVIKIANNFDWKKGRKEVIVHSNNLGLRAHVLQCGQLTERYGAIIMLEDDIYVSDQYYDYALQMLKSYQDKDYIAGISLYTHKRNVNVRRPFQALKNEFDVFFMQFAQSWGQCWSKAMWRGFYEWYLESKNSPFEEDIPLFVKSWPETSWLKFYINYLVLSNKYFVYPYQSLSTNFGDSGSHVKKANNNYQVPLCYNRKEYNTPNLDEAIRYDVFFENEKVIDNMETCIDLFGSKSNIKNKRFWLSSQVLPYHIVDSFGLNFRPHELNVILNNPGKDIFLYDTSVSEEPTKKARFNRYKNLLGYDYSGLSKMQMIKGLIASFLGR